MRINHVAGVLLIALGLVVFALAQGIPVGNRPVAYVVGVIFLVIGLWRLFAPKGH